MLEQLTDGRVLIVDDTKTNIDILVAALKNECRISVATNGPMALTQVDRNPPDLILLDIMMPDMDGYQVCSILKAKEETSAIPIIFITALHEVRDKSKGFDLGAVDYITKPFEIAEVKARVRTHLSLRQAMKALADQNRILDRKVAERTEALRSTQLEIIYRLGRAAEYRDNETGLHIKRMSHFCRAVAVALGCDDDFCDLVFNASPMHDIGKIGISDTILLKPGRLDVSEFTIMKTHTTIGAEILSGHDSRLLEMAYVIALTHHEKWDGSGYPRGLSGEDIPLAGRIVAVCDVFDALTSKRPYKEPWPLEKALNELRVCKGSHFEPKVVEAFFKVLPDVLGIKEHFGDDDGVPISLQNLAG
ncbi:MAG: HD domain-containing phosphohydrolase [Syntrophobacteraceae bacterium]